MHKPDAHLALPDVSVVIPAYNSAHIINEALYSALNQSGISLEVVIVDDGSTDNTAQVIAACADPRVRFIRQENQGPGAARNTGIRAARAELIAFLDADDILLPESLDARLDIFRRYPDVDFVFADTFVELKKGKRSAVPFFKERMMLQKFKDCVESAEGPIYFFNKLQRDCCMKENLFPWTGTVMVKRACLMALGLFDTQLRGSEDKLMWIKLMKQYRVAFLDQPYAVYKKYRSGLTLDFERYCVDSIANARMFLATECTGKNRSHTRVMRHKISDHYFELGYHYFGKCQTGAARPNFFGAIRFNPGDIKSYAYFALSCLPARVVLALRGARKKTTQRS